MRTLIGTSLKMNFTSSEAAAYFDALRPMVAPLASCELFVLPPFTSIWVARDRFRDSNVVWGAQDVHAENAGAHTGDVSAPMLADLGCTFVEVGHSERRRDHGESDELVAHKVRQVLSHDMTPIMCVGEPGPGKPEAALDHVLRQARAGMSLLPKKDRVRVVIAYEPVWAIGEGAAAADPTHIGAVHRGLQELGARVIYGGSVDPLTAGPILAQRGVDGLFVGRAALDPKQFAAIAQLTGA
jgi:triosephosphate isomerase (TIM)